MKLMNSPMMLLALIAGFTVSQSAHAQDFGKSVTGKVVYDAPTAPKAAALAVNKDKAHCLSKGAINSEAWEVNSKNLGLKNVFVWLEAKDGKMPIHPKLKAAKAKTHTIAQPCCKFIPHALVMRQGDILKVTNTAPIAHNFRWVGRPPINNGGNILMPAGGKPFEIKNLAADAKFPIIVSCDIHSWMSAYVRVFDHPYATLTDENGQFTMELPPAGDYVLKMWHPASGWVGGFKGRKGYPVNIKANADTEAGSWKQGP